jgi:hypothetical protein
MKSEYNNQAAERWLNAALKQYGEAEPRPGIETRILANLQAERVRLTLRPWWWRPAAAAVTITVLIAGAWLLRRGPDVISVPISNQPTAVTRNQEPSAPIASANGLYATPQQPRRSRSKSLNEQPSSIPRLEQFPAPAPLNEQEEMLAQYVREHRREATMVARARAELLKTELLRFQLQPALPANLQESEP